MKYYKFFFLSMFLFANCTQNKTKLITEFSQNDFIDAILLDVRTPEEFNAGHIENALNINWFDPEFAKKVLILDKNKTIYIYCKKGGRSAEAHAKFQELGYSQTVNLEGGYDAWIAKKQK